jgi:hypothetical protein
MLTNPAPESVIRLPDGRQETITKIPVGAWVLEYSKLTGRSVYSVTSRELPVLPTLFGDMSILDKVLYRFNNRNKNLGLWLEGIKGMGKTSYIKYLTLHSGKAVIYVNNIPDMDAFYNYITGSLFEGSIIVFDEFEKWMTKSEPVVATFLKLLDGAMPTHLLFVLATNSLEISSFLKDRLARVHYRVHFDYLTRTQIEEACLYNNIVPTVIQKIIDHTFYLEGLTYDNLMGIIDELKLFPDSLPENLIKDLALFQKSHYYFLYRASITFDTHVFDFGNIRMELQNPFVNKWRSPTDTLLLNAIGIKRWSTENIMPLELIQKDVSLYENILKGIALYNTGIKKHKIKYGDMYALPMEGTVEVKWEQDGYSFNSTMWRDPVQSTIISSEYAIDEEGSA